MRKRDWAFLLGTLATGICMFITIGTTAPMPVKIGALIVGMTIFVGMTGWISWLQYISDNRR